VTVPLSRGTPLITTEISESAGMTTESCLAWNSESVVLGRDLNHQEMGQDREPTSMRCSECLGQRDKGFEDSLRSLKSRFVSQPVHLH